MKHVLAIVSVCVCLTGCQMTPDHGDHGVPDHHSILIAYVVPTQAAEKNEILTQELEAMLARIDDTYQISSNTTEKEICIEVIMKDSSKLDEMRKQVSEVRHAFETQHKQIRAK